jgi:hypothetical protein
MAKRQYHSLVISAAQDVADQFRGVWGFVDNRIRRAIISDKVLLWLRLARHSAPDAWASESAQWMADSVLQWAQDVTELLAAKHRMQLDEE